MQMFNLKKCCASLCFFAMFGQGLVHAAAPANSSTSSYCQSGSSANVIAEEKRISDELDKVGNGNDPATLAKRMELGGQLVSLLRKKECVHPAPAQ
jgi:indole-3-glycerol phosphate synthase